MLVDDTFRLIHSIGHWADISSQVAIDGRSSGMRIVRENGTISDQDCPRRLAKLNQCTYGSVVAGNPERAVLDPSVPLIQNLVRNASENSSDVHLRDGIVDAEAHIMMMPWAENDAERSRSRFKIMGLTSC